MERESPKYIDWEITTMFCSALHLVSEYLSRRGVDIPNSHKQMKKVLSVRLPHISILYSLLLKLSWNARYGGYDSVKYCKSNAVEYYVQIKDGLSRY